MKHAYDWADVAFDYWIWESDVDSPSVRWVKQLFDEGKLVRSEGAIGLDLSEDGLGFCLLLKSDGTGLYATKDLELARRKFQDQKIEKSIYVVDTRQALHFKQVFKALEKLGFEQAKDCFHLQYNFVELPDGAMSSRKGNVVPLMQLVERMQTMVKEQYLSRYEEGPEADFSKNIWTAEEKSLVAHQVAQGAIKYGMVRMDNNKKIVFDMNEWLKLDGESGPFIQYSYARIASLCRKLNFRAEDKVNWTLLASEYERGLAVLLMQFNTVVLGAAEGYRPASLCGYLFDLSKRFNLFYHECPIGTAESGELRLARLALAYACGETLKRGLGLLGVPVPNRM
jgi:arginyl-tRNA synthetase